MEANGQQICTRRRLSWELPLRAPSTTTPTVFFAGLGTQLA